MHPQDHTQSTTPPPAAAHEPPAQHAGATHELDDAREVLRDEARAIEATAHALDDAFTRACDLIERTASRDGTVLVTGLGKSGHIGAKISATLTSVGVASHPVHPTEAVHGDLGRFRASDAVLCLSHSGETDEVVTLAALLRQDKLPIISFTGAHAEPSSLERVSDVVLRIPVDREAGGQPAPTSSTTAALALGDAIALAVAKRRRFGDDDFARTHPGGQLGGMLRPVTDLLRFRVGENTPLTHPQTPVGEALAKASADGRRPGALLIVEDGRLIGIFTDGDLRRLVLHDPASLARPIKDVMTASPRTIRDTSLARDAVAAFREHRQDEIPVVDAHGRPVGLLDVQDLIAMRLVRD